MTYKPPLGASLVLFSELPLVRVPLAVGYVATALQAGAMPFLSGRSLNYRRGMTFPKEHALAFERPEDLAGWLAEHYAASSELWVRIYKAASGQRSVTWTDCVVEAIRFG